MANYREKKIESTGYKDGLSGDEKRRYEAKISIVGGLDPYEGKYAWSDEVNLLPAVTYPDIVNYLLFTPSPYSADDLKAYKSLDAYNQFVCGWVREKVGIVHGQYVIVMAKVLHSQRMREKPLKPWVIAEKNGKIVAAHCNCMAGLGEACTHVSALLFSIEATVKIRDAKTFTQEKAYWLLPSDCKKISYKEVNEINFVSAKTAKKQLDMNLETVSSSLNCETPSIRKSRSVPEATFNDLLSFAEDLSKLNTKPALLSLIEPYSDNYVPKFDSTDFPVMLSELRNDKLIGAGYKEIVEKCSTIEISCSKQQSENVEHYSQGQSDSKIWYKFRAGRVTASKAKAVCRMDKASPSQSLIKAICYPDVNKFQTIATKWGLDQEQTARDVFMKEIGPVHDNCRMENSGFVISTTFPMIGASPDGLFMCECCGSAVVEIKCPFNIRNEEINIKKL